LVTVYASAAATAASSVFHRNTEMIRAVGALTCDNTPKITTYGRVDSRS
jgi:hypothetical protein